MRKFRFLVVLTMLFSGHFATAQLVKTAEEEAAYTKVLTERSRKIVDVLHLSDAAKAEAVTNILVEQYKNIGKVYDLKEAEEKLLKKANLSEDATELKQRMIKLVAQRELEKLHRAFIGKLQARLTPDQVGQVKDGMTYGVLEVTYKGYVDMIPSLTEQQKTYIMANLIEAREYAMDGGSSREKHWWFGKYKGRINNYLSKEGYNLDLERKNWKKRRAAAQASR